MKIAAQLCVGLLLRSRAHQEADLPCGSRAIHPTPLGWMCGNCLTRKLSRGEWSEIPGSERIKMRPLDFEARPPAEQWRIDKLLRVLDYVPGGEDESTQRQDERGGSAAGGRHTVSRSSVGMGTALGPGEVPEGNDGFASRRSNVRRTAGGSAPTTQEETLRVIAAYELEVLHGTTVTFDRWLGRIEATREILARLRKK